MYKNFFFIFFKNKKHLKNSFIYFCHKYNKIFFLQELYKIKDCLKYKIPCTNSCSDNQFSDRMLDIKLVDADFYKVYSINDLFAIFKKKPDARYILNGGNTAHGNFIRFWMLQIERYLDDISKLILKIQKIVISIYLSTLNFSPFRQ